MKITTAVLASILAMSSSMALAQAGGGAGGGAAGGGAAAGAAGSAGSAGSASTGSTGSGTSSTTGTNSGESYRNYPGRNAVVDAGTRIDNKQIAGLRWTANKGAQPAKGAFPFAAPTCSDDQCIRNIDFWIDRSPPLLGF